MKLTKLWILIPMTGSAACVATGIFAVLNGDYGGAAVSGVFACFLAWQARWEARRIKNGG